MIDFAPIGLTVYKRLEHVKQTVEALKANVLASKSRLYVFSDAPKPGDEDDVSAMRTYIKSISGFSCVEIIERKENSRINNNRGGHRFLLDKYGKLIWLEEDIVTAPGFLTFMNTALNYYEDVENILSVSGHTPNLKSLNTLTSDVYFVRRFHPWGVGFWRDKYLEIEPIPEFSFVKRDSKLKSELDQVGSDLWNMVLNDSLGLTNALDIRACYLMAKEGYFSVLPQKTLVKNIGLDGSGLHCGSYDMYKGDKLNDKVEFVMEGNVIENSDIQSEYRGFYSPNIIVKLYRKMLDGSVAKKLKCYKRTH